VLSAGESSRLDKRLVYDLQLAQEVSAGQSSSQLASTFSITVTLRKGKDPAEALKIVDEELAKLRAAPPSADEMERARAPRLTQLVFEVEKVTASANLLNELNQGTHDPGFLDKILAQYQAATPADVQATAVRWLPQGKRVVAIVTPTPGAPRAGRLVGGSK
jgi:zinc protease